MQMRCFKILLPLFTIALCSFDITPRDQWVSLFDGKDLSKWTVKIAGYPLGENYGNTFRADSGILKIRYDKYDSFKNRFGAIYYNKKFANYRLRLQYRFVGQLTKGAPVWGYRDSGIQYHCQAPSTLRINQSFPISLEFNLKGGNGKDERPDGELCLGGMYCTIDGERNKSFCNEPTIKKTFHGDQWVSVEVDVHNGQYSYYINGEKILSFSNPKYDPTNEIVKNVIPTGKSDVTDGYISLQSNSHPIDFRKIEIMEYK